jgi:hypothetical protein
MARGDTSSPLLFFHRNKNAWYAGGRLRHGWGPRKQGGESSPEQEDHPSESETSTLFGNATKHGSVAECGQIVII